MEERGGREGGREGGRGGGYSWHALKISYSLFSFARCFSLQVELHKGQTVGTCR